MNPPPPIAVTLPIIVLDDVRVERFVRNEEEKRLIALTGDELDGSVG